MRTIVVMGVSGSGKSTVGAALAEALSRPFVDGDELHPASNREKMRAGVALTDADRQPWLRAVGARLAVGDGVVIACSALKRAYRDTLREMAPDSYFAELDASRELLVARLASRQHEYMPASLLDSQLATLEPLDASEPGDRFDGTLPLAQLVTRIAEAVVGEPGPEGRTAHTEV